MIDFKKLNRADIWIASEEPTPEDNKAFSEFLKAQRAKQSRPQKARVTAPARKKAKAAAK